MMGESDVTILWTRLTQCRRLSSVSDNVNVAEMTLAHTTGSKNVNSGRRRREDLLSVVLLGGFVGFEFGRGCCAGLDPVQ
jgi:hypothetical protein